MSPLPCLCNKIYIVVHIRTPSFFNFYSKIKTSVTKFELFILTFFPNPFLSYNLNFWNIGEFSPVRVKKVRFQEQFEVQKRTFLRGIYLPVEKYNSMPSVPVILSIVKFLYI